jgi:hypothetical protein
VHALERADPTRGAGTGDSVDRAAVEAVSAQRDLETRDLRVRDGCGGSGRRERRRSGDG